MPASDKRAERVALALAAAGAGLVVLSSLGAGGLATVPFALWALLPWAVLYLGRRVFDDPWIPGGAGALALAAELGVRASVFVFPRGSTAAVALVFSPAVVTVLLAVGGGIGFGLGRVWRAGGALARGAVVGVSTIGLWLAFTALARPDLLPIAVARRHAALKRIGEPRAVAGGSAFERIPVSDRPAWHRAADLDGRPGEEVVVVEHRGAELLDPLTFESRGEIEFGWEDRPFTTSWTTLARLDGELVAPEDFTLSAAVHARPSANGPAYLALFASAPRDVGRWRLLLVAAGGEIAYDEVLGLPLRLLTARSADGARHLFLSGDGLSALRPARASGSWPPG